jgi:CRP-like cAMP-binding protein
MVSFLRSSSVAPRPDPRAFLAPRLPSQPGAERRPTAMSPRNECLGKTVARLLSAEERLIPAGHEVYAEGEQAGDFHVILEGWAILYQILEDGRRQILDFALPGSILGLGASSQSEMGHTAESLTDLRLAVVPRHRLGELIARDSSVAMRLVEAMAGNLEAAYESLTDAGRRTAREAVAHLLLRLARRVVAGQEHAGTPVLELPLTLEHIGDALGLTAVHVCRTLRGLREDGVVTYCKGRLRIESAARLADAAGVFCDDGASGRCAA